ncbi:MAG: metallophosphoesterase [candidate division WOR-3 bacterium]
MRILECSIPDKVAYLVPIGDIHFEDPGFTESSYHLLKGYIDWVRDNRNARVFLMGDLFNCAGRNSRTQPHFQKPQAFQRLCELFSPIASQIIGAIEGNHEARLVNDFGVSLLEAFCLKLGIPYCKWSAVIKMRVGRRTNERNKAVNVYWVYCHHTTGGGATVGGKLNRIERLAHIIEGVDVICGGHNHALGVISIDRFYPADRHIYKRRIWIVATGSYLEWDGSYSEQRMMQPTKLGSPRIRFSGERGRKDIHVSV